MVFGSICLGVKKGAIHFMVLAIDILAKGLEVRMDLLAKVPDFGGGN